MVAATDIPLHQPEPMPDFREQPRSARVPVEEITARARHAKPGKTMLTILGGLLFGVAWLAAKATGGLWLAFSWCWTACEMGWADARGKGPSKSALLEENVALREAVRRLGGQA